MTMAPLWRRWKERPVFSRLAAISKTAIVTLWARLASLALFAVTARQLTTQDNASVIYIFGVANLVVQIGSLGWLNLTRRLVARFTYERPELVRGFIQRSFQVPALTVAAASILLIAGSLSGLITPAIAEAVFYTGLAALPLLFALVQREYLIALNRPVIAILLSEAIPLSLVLLCLLFLKVHALPQAAALIIGSWLFSAIAQGVVLRRLVGEFLKTPTVEFKTWTWTKVALVRRRASGGASHDCLVRSRKHFLMNFALASGID